ncbi:GNAT family N-acetyltransferase [Rhodobacterales bacterium HKCCSP123]|nr:GNAT family N-acetyltransferase [Rhodobacterales bacterium HKCCSP123]
MTLERTGNASAPAPARSGMMTGNQDASPADAAGRDGNPSGYRITSVTEVTDRAEIDALLLEYYGVIVRKITAAGIVHDFTPTGLMASFWPNLDRILPPNGRFLLVRDGADGLMGCATLHRIGPETGEFKRLYVRPEANGHGLGRALVMAQMEAARSMGWQRLMVNIIKGNRESIRIFEALGFRYIPRYEGCSDPIEADPHFVYLQKDLA